MIWCFFGIFCQEQAHAQAGATGTQAGPAGPSGNQSKQAIKDAQTEAACLNMGAAMCTSSCKDYPSIVLKNWCPPHMAGSGNGEFARDPKAEPRSDATPFAVPAAPPPSARGDKLPVAGTDPSPAKKDPGTTPTGSDKTGGKPSGGGSGGGGSGGGGDPAACQQAAQDAYSACGSQGGGGQSAGGSGLSSYGSYLSGASSSAANANIQQGGLCSNRWQTCVQVCQDVDPNQASYCRGLANQQAQMGQQAMQNQQAAQQAAQSSSQSSSMPNAKAADDCNANPSTPECKALAEANKQTQGKTAFGEAPQDVRAKDFDVGDPRDGTKLGYQGSGIGIDQIKAGSKNGTIANNSGGGIPGAGGDAGGAKLGGGRGGSPGNPGYTTDILQGYQGGGGGAQAGGSLATNGDADGGFSGYGGGGARGPASEGLDLRKYLPGGRNDPGTRLGGFRPFSLEINGPHYNVWSRISDRYMEKCKLGELIDCR